MSKECPFQTRQSSIKEARCLLPLYNNGGCNRGNRDYTCGSWFCEFYKEEKDCPIIKEIVNHLEYIKEYDKDG